MFEGLSPWTWVIASYLQVVIAYGIYLAYLRRRAARLQHDEEDDAR